MILEGRILKLTVSSITYSHFAIETFAALCYKCHLFKFFINHSIHLHLTWYPTSRLPPPPAPYLTSALSPPLCLYDSAPPTTQLSYLTAPVFPYAGASSLPGINIFLRDGLSWANRCINLKKNDVISTELFSLPILNGYCNVVLRGLL